MGSATDPSPDPTRITNTARSLLPGSLLSCFTSIRNPRIVTTAQPNRADVVTCIKRRRMPIRVIRRAKRPVPGRHIVASMCCVEGVACGARVIA